MHEENSTKTERGSQNLKNLYDVSRRNSDIQYENLSTIDQQPDLDSHDKNQVEMVKKKSILISLNAHDYSIAENTIEEVKQEQSIKVMIIITIIFYLIIDKIFNSSFIYF